MTSIRIAVVAALAAGALFAGGSNVQHAAPASVSLASAYKQGPVTCCGDDAP